MPRVSAEHLEQRRRQILEAAHRCFARKGFYETSMQDVLREAGLSTGGVYRYFKSKDEIIQAIAADVSNKLGSAMAEICSEQPVPPIDEVAGRLAATIEELSGDGGSARVALAVWAMAVHDETIAATAREVLGRIRGWLIELADQMKDAGRLRADADAEAVGAAMFGLLPGFLLQHLILQDVDAASYRRGVDQLFSTVPKADSADPGGLDALGARG